MGEIGRIESSAGQTACYVARPERPDGGAKQGAPGVLVLHAVVPFYADHDLDISGVSAAQQWHFAEKDDFVPDEWLADFRATVAKLGRSDVELYQYPGTEHAFFNVSRPEAYKEEAAERAWGRMLTFFGTYLN